MRSLKLFCGSVVAIICLLASYGIYTHYFSLSAKLDHYVQSYVDLELFSGAVLVAKEGKIVLCKGYGMANYEHMVSNTPQTKFHIGSITKQFTSMAIMQLVQAGKLKLSDTIASILPDYPRGKEITIYQLLTMTSGIPDYLNDFDDFDVTRPTNIDTLIAAFKDKPLIFISGSKYKYSNSGYVLLAAIIERLSGQSYETFLQEHIFKQLGMNNSGMLHQKQVLAYRAQGYKPVKNGLENAPYYDPSIGIGAGMLYSTVEDMYSWDRALYTDKLLLSDLRNQLWQPYLTNYALGWQTGTVAGHNYVWHGGDFCDCAARILRFIKDDVCVIVLSNFDTALAPVDRISKNLAAMVFGRIPRVAIKVNPVLFDAYVGQYELDSGFVMTIIKDREHLLVQPKGQGAIELLPESETIFFNDNELYAQVSFVKSESGQITKLIWYEDGQQAVPIKKINGKGRVVAQIDPRIYDAYVGTYVGTKNSERFKVIKRDDLLLIQKVSFGTAPLFPESETEFFLKAADEQVSFIKDASGNVIKLIVHQGGHDISAERVK